MEGPQGALVLPNTGVTEDAPARRVVAGQKPACIAGWGT
jgi:hypothetical protein